MAAAIAISLPEGQRWQLEQLRRGAKDGRLIRRSQVVLLTADGKSVGEIEEVTGFKRGAIAKWRKRFLLEGIQGLYDRPRPGAKAKATERYLNLLRRTVMRSPRKMGYAFTVWTGDRLAEYLAQKTGIRLTGDWVRELLKRKLAFSHQRPKHTLKGKRDEKEHAKARKALEALKKGLLSKERPTNSGTRTKRSSTSTPIWLPNGPRVGVSRAWRVRVRTKSGWSTVPLTSPRARLSTTSARRRAVWASMTW